jgi:phage gp46-like protein
MLEGDVEFLQGVDGLGVLTMLDNDLKNDEGIWTAVTISLLTDARADSDDQLPPGAQNRGFFGDVLLGVSLGSKLWLLERAKLTRDTLNLAREYAYESLIWMIEEGAADDVIVASSAVAGTLVLDITIERIDGGSLNKEYSLNWDSMTKG